MTSSTVFKALLAMDAYNRGYSVGMVVPGGSQIGTATVIDQSGTTAGTPGFDAGFYAVAYNWNGTTVISYRGTDAHSELLFTDMPFWNGSYTVAEVKLAVDFYNEVAGNPLAQSTTATILSSALPKS